jgi:GTPase SAR1 family protein
VYGLVWLANGVILATAGQDRIIRLWDQSKKSIVTQIEGHTGHVTDLDGSPDGKLIASISWDDTVRLWRTDTGALVAMIPEESARRFHAGVAFHPNGRQLATLGNRACVINIWEIDLEFLLGIIPTSEAIQYKNAKVVMVGDSGVGKTGLGYALADPPFRPTDSTHGRHVWTFESRHVELEDGSRETHETLLWDLAGQPGYRLIHHLYLNETSVALVVFDARSETDPFSGVLYWVRALRQGKRIECDAAQSLKMFLVAARMDRGAISVSRDHIDEFVREHGFVRCVETSAKEGWQIPELAEMIRSAIDWESLPRVNSNEVFHRIKAFLVSEKETGRLLDSVEDLYRSFTKSREKPEDEGLRDEFQTCIGLLENRGLIRRLSLGDLVLLRPEVLDAYAASLINAAKTERDGLGAVPESVALSGEFPMAEAQRIKNRRQEKLLLVAVVEDLLRHEVALREQTGDGPHLVFPSQLTRDWEEAPDPTATAVAFRFEGPVRNIYTGLVVRLSNCGIFRHDSMWRNAAIFRADVGGTCGLLLREFGDGRGEIALFFDDSASQETCYRFEQFVQAHLRSRALEQSIEVRRRIACPVCSEPVPDRSIALRRERGLDWIICARCDARVPLGASTAPSGIEQSSPVPAMSRSADAGRDRDAAASLLTGKLSVQSFDVFLCYNRADKPLVNATAQSLRRRGILPWLDERDLAPSTAYIKELEKVIKSLPAAAIFLGSRGIGRFQSMEIEAIIAQRNDRYIRIIPVFLPDAPQDAEFPLFVSLNQWVDFRVPDPDPLDMLVKGINGLV